MVDANPIADRQTRSTATGDVSSCADERIPFKDAHSSLTPVLPGRTKLAQVGAEKAQVETDLHAARKEFGALGVLAQRSRQTVLTVELEAQGPAVLTGRRLGDHPIRYCENSWAIRYCENLWAAPRNGSKV